MKLYFFEVQPWQKCFLKEYFKDIPYTALAEPLTLQNCSKYADATVVSIFLKSIITKELLACMPSLQYITTRTTGFDHINIKAAHERGIVVSNVPTYGENTVAEFAFALILALSRKLMAASESIHKGTFSCEGLTGFDLKGKTLGVVGVGNIGKYVIRIAQGFEMNVVAFDPKQNELLAKELNFMYTATLEELLKQSDIITLHAPYNPHTHHLINKNNVQAIKSGALLINTARGGLVETEALIWALDNKILAGAGLDVLEGERGLEEEQALLYQQDTYQELHEYLANHILMHYPQVIITPHTAFNTHEALLRILKTTEENIRSFLQNKFINTVS